MASVAWELSCQSARRRRIGSRWKPLAGVKTLELMAHKTKHEWVFRVAMGAPILEPAKIPFKGEAAGSPVVGYALPVHTEQGRSAGHDHLDGQSALLRLCG